MITLQRVSWQISCLNTLRYFWLCDANKFLPSPLTRYNYSYFLLISQFSSINQCFRISKNSQASTRRFTVHVSNFLLLHFESLISHSCFFRSTKKYSQNHLFLEEIISSFYSEDFQCKRHSFRLLGTREFKRYRMVHFQKNFFQFNRVSRTSNSLLK